MSNKFIVFYVSNHKNSFVQSIAETYYNKIISKGFNCELINIYEINFDPVLRKKTGVEHKAEKDINEIRNKILISSHIVFVFPLWWGGMPAILKGFFDRVFVSGFAFKYTKTGKGWIGLLKEKASTVFVTMDTPKWYYKYFFRRPVYHQLKKAILGFCGIKVKKFKFFSVIKKSNECMRKKWLKEVETIALNDIKKGESIDSP